MEESIHINREEILKNAELESELSDLKQHADKMIRGFENFNKFSSNRAIWEMVQNACDLTAECEILIDYSRENFSFSHNGKPFTTKALISLIKQVSGKYGEESDFPEVGKYGTGFLTTHTFGRKFLINSILTADNAFFEIKDFLVDRSPMEWKELSSNIKIQKNNVYQIIKNGNVIHLPNCKTTFTYLPETEREKQYIIDSSKDLEEYIPIVLTINERLKKVTLKDKNGNESIFLRINKELIANDKGIILYKTEISCSGKNKVLYSLIEEENGIEVILPINENLELIEFSDKVAKLFLYYPLVGSEDFGLNFIINCKNFLPTEPRDGIHLMSNKDQVKDQEEKNRIILKKASKLIFDFLKSNILSVPNPLLYAKVNFKRSSEDNLLNEYFEELQSLWTEELKDLPIVETSFGYKRVSEVCFYDRELIECIDVFDEIYQLASRFYDNIPTKSNIILWSKFVGEWTDEHVNFIGHEHLVLQISNSSLINFNKQDLLKYYSDLIDKGRINYFSDFKLLPNVDGEFNTLTNLLFPENLPKMLIEIGKILIPRSIERLIHEDFYFKFQLGIFNRRDFSNAVKTELDERDTFNLISKPKEFAEEYFVESNIMDNNVLDFNYFKILLDYCKLTNNINSSSKPSQLLKIISRYYHLDEELIFLPSIENKEENLNIRSSRRLMIKTFFNLIELHNYEWVKNNRSLLLDIATCYDDSYEDLFMTSKIYPNQLNQLKSVNELKRDIDTTDEIKDLYCKVVRKEIRSDLVCREFNNFISKDHFIHNKYLTTIIEEVFFNTDIHDINEHPFKDEILTIISNLRDKYYTELFPRLDDKKANLMLEIVTNEKTKDDIFSIVTLKEEQLKKLGLLVQNDNFEAILNKATMVLLQEKEKKSDFRHKYEIGTNIERLIRQRLSKDLQQRVTFKNEEKLETSDVQGGQDIIIFVDEKPIYFIEVKSRWNAVNSVSMSKLQLQRSVEEDGRYALCSVDISRYLGPNDKYNLKIEEILPLTKFVKNIGKEIRPLIQENLIAEQNQYQSIHLIDYRGIIPQDIIKGGSDFNNFIDNLLDVIDEISINNLN